MVSARAAWSNRLLTTILVVTGVAAALLLYAFGVRVLAPRVDSQRVIEDGKLVGSTIQLEVRNGCGVAGLAAITTQYLRDHGFDVVETGNYSVSDVKQSKVIDRVGDMESAAKVARVLGIAEERVEQDINADLYLNASVVIGMDYKDMKPFEPD
ncbi:MAG: LytR C-terminal domain-containing protein [Rhodothermales bacterium]|nr:LytR C-terminal domain-containing protein [Rhodothermales bacterium]